MFEAEEQLEKKSFSANFLVIFLVIVAIAGVAAYFLVRSQKDLTADEAAGVLKVALRARGPAITHFHAGLVVPSVDEKPRDPHYKLLEKAGMVKLQKATGGATRVEVTALGDGTFSKFPEFKKIKNPDGTDGYVVPLAERQLVAVSKVTMQGPSAATVEYTWKWAPNKMGDVFDASGETVKSNFNTWERAKLIEKYGVDFYHGEPTKATVTLVRGSKGWQISNE
jgi:hypothetical protein